MKISNNGISLIKSFEGCKLESYLCPSNVWTIGYGHTSGVTQGMKITQAQADEFLKTDLAKFEKYVENTGLSLNQNQFDTLVSFTYNCGNGNLKMLIKNRTLPQIGEALLLYNKSNGKVLNGLVRRRKAERELFFRKEVSMLKPYDFKQNDKAWGSNSYAVDGESSTIKSAGCGPTAMANVLASIVSPYIDPLTCASWARMKGYKVYNSGTSYLFPVSIGKEYGVKVERVNQSNIYGNRISQFHDSALEALLSGNWLIACMGKGLWTSSGHYITVYGYHDGMVYINDPASTNKNRACNTWELFKSQVKYYWIVNVPEDIKQMGIKKDGVYRQADKVREIQMCLKTGYDSVNLTLNKTITVSKAKNRRHNVVYPLQKALKALGYYSGKLDCDFGSASHSGAIAFQSNAVGLTKPDGEFTAKKKSWKALLGI